MSEKPVPTEKEMFLEHTRVSIMSVQHILASILADEEACERLFHNMWLDYQKFTKTKQQQSDEKA